MKPAQVEVKGKTRVAYEGRFLETDCAAQDRDSYPFGVFASKELLLRAVEYFEQQFLENNPGWQKVTVVPGSNVVWCAKLNNGEWDEVSVEVQVMEIPVFESVESIEFVAKTPVPEDVESG